jgi:hypothetical protein
MGTSALVGIGSGIGSTVADDEVEEFGNIDVKLD